MPYISVDLLLIIWFLLAAFTDKGKFLLAARRFKHGAHTQYIISLDADDLSQGSNAYIGKLRLVFSFDAMPLIHLKNICNPVFLKFVYLCFLVLSPAGLTIYNI